MTFSLALVYGSNFCHYVDSLHHYVNVSYLFIKLEPIKQIKRFESCLFNLNCNTNTSSIKTKGFKQLKTNTLLKQSNYRKIFKDYQTDVASKSDVVVNFTVCLAQIVCAKKTKTKKKRFDHNVIIGG